MAIRLIAFMACATTVAAQSSSMAPRTPAFEAASVQPSRGGGAVRMEMPAADRFTAANATLRDLILFAYHIEQARLLGAPEWIGVEQFDIDARAGQPFPAWSSAGPPIPLLLMVRTLLADRFGLVVHQETRELPAYALVVARGDRKFGPEITPSRLTCDDPVGPGATPPLRQPGQPQCGGHVTAGTVVATGLPMSQFATVLSNVVERVVIDRTRLPGTFDFRLIWTPDSDGAALFGALREQLGLTLDATRAPLEVLVLDRVAAPAAD